MHRYRSNLSSLLQRHGLTPRTRSQNDYVVPPQFMYCDITLQYTWVYVSTLSGFSTSLRYARVRLPDTCGKLPIVYGMQRWC